MFDSSSNTQLEFCSKEVVDQETELSIVRDEGQTAATQPISIGEQSSTPIVIDLAGFLQLLNQIKK